MTRSIYEYDPRVRGESDQVFHLPDPEGVVTVLWNESTGRWDTYDGAGHPFEPACHKENFDEAVEAVIGPPLWKLEAAMMCWAARNGGWLDVAVSWTDVDDGLIASPNTGTVAGSAAIENLMEAHVFDEMVSGPHVLGYLLTGRGWAITEVLIDETDEEGVRLTIGAHVTQTHGWEA